MYFIGIEYIDGYWGRNPSYPGLREIVTLSVLGKVQPRTVRGGGLTFRALYHSKCSRNVRQTFGLRVTSHSCLLVKANQDNSHL